MATISHVFYESFLARVEPQGVSWHRLNVRQSKLSRTALSLPTVFFKTGMPWTEANLWLAEKFERVVSGDLSALSLQHNAWCLCAYLTYLEKSKASWKIFPKHKTDHPTTLYRRHLIQARDDRRLAPSTASARMACVANFYRWAHDVGVLSYCPINTETYYLTTGGNHRGFVRSKTISTTDLHIKRKRTHPLPSIGGLTPVSAQTRQDILKVAAKHCSEEFALMLAIGFSTGMRLRSILDLKLETLSSAIRGEVKGVHYLRIGPRFNVATKFSINGHALIPTELLHRLQAYAESLRRMRRAAKALPEHQTLLFLNRFGRPYGPRERDRSPSINVDMARLRTAAEKEGIDLKGFYFHCTRATFGTSIVLAGLRTSGVSVESIICRLTELLMHRDETTSLRYVRYVEGAQVVATHEAEYSAWLFGGKDG